MTQNYASTETPSAANLLNFNSSGSTLSLFPQDMGTYTFYVLGHSVTNKYAFRQVDYTVVCGLTSQTVSLVNPDTVTIEVDKNIAATLLAENNITSMFTVADQERCQIQRYEVVDTSGTAFQSSNTLYSMLKLADRAQNIPVLIDSTIPMTNGKVLEQIYDFKIKAVAEGGNSMMKHI